MLRRVDDSDIYELEEFDEYNPEHVGTLLNMHYILVGERKLRFGFRELVWVLNNCDFVPMPVMQCMKEMSPENGNSLSASLNTMRPCCRCLVSAPSALLSTFRRGLRALPAR